MHAIYQCPDGMIRWTGETPGKGARIFSILNRVILFGIPALCLITLIIDEFYDAFNTISTFVLTMIFWRAVLFVLQKVFARGGSCMFYELDHNTLTMHEMNSSSAALNNLIARFCAGDTVRFPAAKKTSCLPRTAITSVMPGKNEHSVLVNGTTELYTTGSAAELIAVLGGQPAQNAAPLSSVKSNIPQRRSTGTRSVSSPSALTKPAGTAVPQLLSQTVKIKAPKKAGTLCIHLPESNMRILGKGIQMPGGLK